MELTLDQALKKGVEAHKAGHVQEADRLYTAILTAQPKHPDANHNMGVLAIRVGKGQEALPFFKAALEASPGTAQYWLSYIDTLIKMEQLAEANAVLNQAKSKGAKGEGFDKLEQRLLGAEGKKIEANHTASEEDQKQPNILNSLKLDQAIKLAKKKSKDGSIEKAKRIYQDILTRFPKNKRAIDGMKAVAGRPVGQAPKVQDPPQDQLQSLINFYTSGKLQKALDGVDLLLLQFPNSITLLNIQGVANIGLGQFAAAVGAFKKVLVIKPGNAGAYYNMGNALKEQGKLEEAIEGYNKALAFKPDYADVYNNMGITLKKQGKLREAIEAYNKALAIKPDYADAYNNMGNALQEQGALKEAIEAYYNALAIKPDYADAYNNIGLALRGQGNLEEAMEAYSKALNLRPDYADASYNMGITLQEQGKRYEAIEAYDKALAVKPDHANAFLNMGISLKELGKLEEAIEAFNKTLAIRPDYADAYLNIGITLKEQGNLEEAIEAYNKALAIKPDYADAKHMRASLTGETTNSAPREYVENLFDGYASKFDQSLVEELEYDIPKILTNLTAKMHGTGSWGSVLDLGCGTGLTGVEIEAFCSNLEGIDLSNKMLEKAKTRNVYDKLTHIDIVDYLSIAELNFDYFISTDVFVYIGNLSEVFRLIKSRNKKPGKLVFSTEHTENDGFHLERSGRYSHSKSYIDSLCEKFSYSISHFSETNLRKEKNIFLTGGVYLLDF